MQLSAILLFGIAVTALPQEFKNDHLTVRPWKPAGRTDSRSPCPLLNTLANHGYLPHDGRNITAKDFGKAIHDALNFDITAGEDQANLQLGALGVQVVDLEDLNAHDIVEHRASLTRNDASSGDSIHIDLPRLQAMLADSTTDCIDISSLAKSRVRVEALSPPITAGQVQQSAGEGGLLLLAMSTVEVPVNSTDFNFTKITTPKDRVREWMTFERLPVKFGWKPAPRQYKFADVGGLTGAILALRQVELSKTA